MGFSQVYDYEGGKLDWLAFALPAEGSAGSEPTVGSVARRDVPTCQLHERLSDLSVRMSQGWAWCAAVNADGVVLGRVRRRHLADSPGATVGEVMDAGPSTYRPSTPAAEMVEVMTRGRFERAFVTDSDGRLLGLVGRQDLEAALAARADA
ncbi:MAG TPA: CBS domain-containing protein, partial [Candidatus Eisenbacteria bacterium]|nr:CBS domain-containing protein [Candidatus Eisenbacteria bacterium]